MALAPASAWPGSSPPSSSSIPRRAPGAGRAGHPGVGLSRPLRSLLYGAQALTDEIYQALGGRALRWGPRALRRPR